MAHIRLVSGVCLAGDWSVDYGDRLYSDRAELTAFGLYDRNRFYDAPHFTIFEQYLLR